MNRLCCMIPMIVRVRVDRVRKAGTVGSDLFSFPPAGGCLSARFAFPRPTIAISKKRQDS